MKTHFITSIIACLLLLSCSNETTLDQNPVGTCLEEKLPDHLEHMDLLTQIFEEDGLISNSKESYANALHQAFEYSSNNFNLDQQETDKLAFAAELSTLPLLFGCAEQGTNEVSYSENQQEFYKTLSGSAKSGAYVNNELGNIIQKMTNDEFETCSIKESTIIYLSHIHMRNHYSFSYPIDIEH